VLYNNHTISNNVHVESTYSEVTKQLRVKVTCDGPFKMYLYYTTEMSRTIVPGLLKRSFHDKIQSNKYKAQALEDQINTAFNEIEALRAKDIEKRNRQTELRTLQTDLNIQIKSSSQSLAGNTDTFNQELTLQLKNLSAVKDNELYMIGSKIQKIFNTNKLNSSINEQILAINKYIDEEALKIKTFRENFLTLTKKRVNKKPWWWFPLVAQEK